MRVRMKVIEDHFDDDDDDDENHGDEERRKTTKKQSRSDMKTFHAESQQENPKFVVQNPRSKIHIQNAKRAQDQTSTPLNFKLQINFFFEQCCARHYNCGSHEAVLK